MKRGQVQTPQQRRANEKFAKREEMKRGKPESAIKKPQKFKSPISPMWLGKKAPLLRFGFQAFRPSSG
jgi:hypothetical protein